MEHITDYHIEQKEAAAVTIGNFDGIHQGHRRLIEETKKAAQTKGLRSVVLTFSPHPMFLFRKKEDFALIMAPEEKKYAMEQMGVDVYIEYPFTKEFAAMKPEDFANDILFDRLNAKVVVVGDDYKFGKDHKGNYELLRALGEKRGVIVKNIPSVVYDGQRVSSSRVRTLLREKNIELANRLLTVPYFILGEVSQGKKLGRKLGFPTVNIVADPVKLFPPNGVYATRTLYKGKMYSGVTNVGVNPTVNGTFKIVETYLFDFHEVVYGQQLKTYFFHWIRSEQKFPSVEELQKQLQKDAKSAEAYFETGAFDFWREKY